jgi:hypothetical protein
MSNPIYLWASRATAAIDAVIRRVIGKLAVACDYGAKVKDAAAVRGAVLGEAAGGEGGSSCGTVVETTSYVSSTVLRETAGGNVELAESIENTPPQPRHDCWKSGCRRS